MLLILEKKHLCHVVILNFIERIRPTLSSLLPRSSELIQWSGVRLSVCKVFAQIASSVHLLVGLVLQTVDALVFSLLHLFCLIYSITHVSTCII